MGAGVGVTSILRCTTFAWGGNAEMGYVSSGSVTRVTNIAERVLEHEHLENGNNG